MSWTVSVTSADVGPPVNSTGVIPRITMAQSDHDVVKTHTTTSPVLWAMPRTSMTSDGDSRQGPSLPERIMTAPLPDITDAMLVNETSCSSMPLSNADRVLVKHNVAARHALKTQNEDLTRQFARIMAAHAAKERLIQAELRSIQQHTLPPKPAGATASAVDISQVMSNPHNLSASNGKYFISPFNRHKAPSTKGESPTTMSLPVAMGHTNLGEDGGQGKYTLSSRHKVGKIGVKSGNVTMAMTTSSGTTTTTMSSATGMRVQTTHTSPALKLKQTSSGGLKLQPVHLQQVNGAISEMKSKGGKPVRVKVQLKVKLPPLKTGKQSPMLPQPKYDPSQLQVQTSSNSTHTKQKQQIRFSASPKEISREDEAKFGALRKIDIVFTGERAEARSDTPESFSDYPTDEQENKTLVLRCADGTLCRVPIGGTNKLQKLVAARDNAITPRESSSGRRRGQRPAEGLGGRALQASSGLKSCLKRPRSKAFPKPRKTVHFAPDVVEVNRESKETELQPTVKIGSNFYTIKLPNIKAVQRVPTTTDRFALKSVALLPKIPELLEDLKTDLDAIPDIDDGASINDGQDEDNVSNKSDTPSEDRPHAARRRISVDKSSDEKPPKYKDVVLQVRMKKKKTPTPSPDIAMAPNAPPPSPDEDQDSGNNNQGKYVVSKVHDRWKVTIKNS